MKDYLTIAELAELSDVPNSTCRRYLSTFHAFFNVKGGNRLKRYEMQSVDVLKRIKSLYDEGFESKEIYNVLINEFPLIIDGDEQQENQENQTVSTLATSDDIGEIKELFKQQQEFNLKLLQEFKKQGEQINQLVEIVTNDKRLFGENKGFLDSMVSDKQQAEIEVSAASQKQSNFFSRLFQIKKKP